MKNLFWNASERRLRSFWRLGIQALVWLILTSLFSVLTVIPIVVLLVGRNPSLQPGSADFNQLVMRSIMEDDFLRLLVVAGTFLATMLSVWLGGRLLDRRRMADFGFHFNRRWWLDFLFGLGLGAGLMAFIFLVELAMGWVTIQDFFYSLGRPFLLSLLLALLGYIAVGIYEEAFSRGYQMKNLAEGLNLPRIGARPALLTAYLISSVIFGSLHAGNPNASTISTLFLIVAGLFLGLGVLLTGELAISIGLHISWNFFQGNIFGFPVSGTDAGAKMIVIHQGGPDVWTGGAFGPEAGLLGLLAILLGCLLILFWVRWRQGSLGLHEQMILYTPRRTQPQEVLTGGGNQAVP